MERGPLTFCRGGSHEGEVGEEDVLLCWLHEFAEYTLHNLEIDWERIRPDFLQIEPPIAPMYHE